MSKNLKNYTTTIHHSKTISEIEQILAEYGATGIMKDYENGNVSAVYFQLETERGRITYKLPALVTKTSQLLYEGWKNGKYKSISRNQAKSMDHARNVAWRVIKDWIDSQLSLLMIFDIEQVFLPYVYDPRTNSTLYENLKESNYDYMALLEE